jgi:hypothetical protein
MAWTQPSSPETANHGEMAAGAGLVPARGETDAYTNRYHEHPFLSKQAGAARIDQLHPLRLDGTSTGPGTVKRLTTGPSRLR